MDMQAGDNELAARAASGDNAAFALLLDRHYDAIFRVAIRYFGIREEAEDLTQQLCVDLVGKLGKFDGRARFSTWLYRVAFNACRDRQRRNRARSVNELAYVGVQQLRRDSEIEISEEVAWLYQALESVGDDLRDTALLILGEELTHAEAGEVLDVSEATISWRMHQLRKKLKALAEEQA